MRRLLNVILLVSTLQGQSTKTDGACFFPPEYIGDYVMQTSINAVNTVEYSTLKISLNSTPIWGNCHKRIENSNFIFMINFRENSCMRCLQLKLMSKNILQVLAVSQKTLSQCYINEDFAKESCPTEESASSPSAVKYILFKIKDVSGYPVAKEYCPIDGRYSVTYRTNDPNRTECMNAEASIDTCTSGASMKLVFPECTDNQDIRFHCLGQWDGPDGQTYLALEDRRKKPIFRCALYRKNPECNVIDIALSNDSTCDTDLHRATRGYETMILKPNDLYYWPTEVENSPCSFPDWLQGEWEHVTVENNTLIYKDHNNFKTYTLKCLSEHTTKDKYLVVSRTQCSDENHFRCIWIQRRTTNVFEFQLGLNPSVHQSHPSLCQTRNFNENVWITQGRVNPTTDLACPISGVYTGMIPETNCVCSKLSSVCTAPELLYYKVFDCNTLQVYEEREYQCLGHWREGGLLYTYTQRRDSSAAGTYECFVGSIVSDKEDYIIIKEAGEHCQRQMDALQSGMKLTQQQPIVISCSEQDTTVINGSLNNTSWSVPEYPTKPFDIDSSNPTNTQDTNSIAGTTMLKPLDWISCLTFIVVINYL